MHLDFRVIGLLASAWGLPLSAASPSSPPINFRVDSIAVADVAPDRIHLKLTLGISTRVHLALKSAIFETVRLNGIPLYIAPLTEKIDFDPSKEWQPIQLAPITVYFRDLETLAPLRDLVVSEHAQFEGQARVELDLSLLPRILLPLRQRTAITVPGGSLARKATLTALGAADFALTKGQVAVRSVREFFGWTDEFARQFAPSLFLVETRYRYSVAGRTYARAARSSGFMIAQDRLVTTAEALRPWQYDAEIAPQLESGDAVFDELSYEVRIWPAGAPMRDDTALSLRNHRIKVASVGSSVESVIIAAGGKVRGVKLGKRDAEENLGVLELAGAIPGAALLHRIASAAKEWDHVAVFRFPINRMDVSVDVIYLPARRVGDRIVLAEPVDSTAFGSPIVLPDGAIGMLQGETSGTLRALP